jgi:hypothetical protein
MTRFIKALIAGALCLSIMGCASEYCVDQPGGVYCDQTHHHHYDHQDRYDR